MMAVRDSGVNGGVVSWAPMVALATLLLTLMGMVYKFDHDLETNLTSMNDRMGKLETETAVIKTRLEHLSWPQYYPSSREPREPRNE